MWSIIVDTETIKTANKMALLAVVVYFNKTNRIKYNKRERYFKLFPF